MNYPNPSPYPPPLPPGQGGGAIPPPAPPPDWQVAAGLASPGAPPPPPPPGWQPGKPTSGKAVASLVCGIAGFVVGFGCQILYLAVLVGVVLGVLGILETGREGKRSGRGLAIAGTITSCLAAVAVVALAVFFFRLGSEAGQQHEQMVEQQIESDVGLIVQRLSEYHRENGSLGPGGPYLARARYLSENAPEANRPNANQPVAGVRGGVVVTALRLEHLVRENELKFGSMASYTLTVTGDNSARLEVRSFAGDKRQIEITDAASGRWYRRQ
ncbi:MAG: hypothetical protein KF754_07990 [Planctomycetes bacterium]|nr:hypothetical protein [Planctomycetota bacterium]